jgi:hypothetical protein
MPLDSLYEELKIGPYGTVIDVFWIMSRGIRGGDRLA